MVKTSSVMEMAKTPSEKPMIRLLSCLLTLPAACGATLGAFLAHGPTYIGSLPSGVLAQGASGGIASRVRRYVTLFTTFRQVAFSETCWLFDVSQSSDTGLPVSEPLGDRRCFSDLCPGPDARLVRVYT